MPNPHASAILALPAGRHPRLSRLAGLLAAKADVTTSEAQAVLHAAALDAGISGLDIEMCQPGASAAVPFVPAAPASTASDYDQGVAALVHARLSGGRR